MSEESIIKEISIWLDNRKFPYQIPRCFIYGWECDFWCMTKDGETREFEIKTSRRDYVIDKNKSKHLDSTKGANYFYYVCPKGLISKDEVSRKYGLIYVSDSLEVVKKPVRLNNFKFTEWEMLANKMYWKWYSLWQEKYINKIITKQEWREGFNLQLDELTPNSTNSQYGLILQLIQKAMSKEENSIWFPEIITEPVINRLKEAGYIIGPTENETSTEISW